MLRWLVLIALYVAAAVVWIVVVNADQGNEGLAAVLAVAAASVLLGWGTGSGWAAVVAWVMVPLALPFGDTNKATGGDDTYPVALLFIFPAAHSTLLILLAAGARTLFDRHRRNQVPTGAGAPRASSGRQSA
jgi:hypothetical protein